MLGVVWYSKPPSGLYDFKYFTFLAPDPYVRYGPSLEYKFSTENISNIKKDIGSLLKEFSCDKRIILYKKDDFYRITLSSQNFYDYDFLLAVEIEKILDKYLTLKLDFEFNEKSEKEFYEGSLPGIDIFYQRTNQNFEYCYDDTSHCLNNSTALGIGVSFVLKTIFLFTYLIEKLKEHSKECGFQYAHIHKQMHNEKYFIRLFVTNGRQGLDLKTFYYNDLEKFENVIADTLAKYDCIHSIKTNSYDEYKREYPQPFETPRELIVLMN